TFICTLRKYHSRDTRNEEKSDSSCRTGNRNRRADARQQQIPRLLSRDDLRRFPGGSLSRQWSAGTVAAHNLALVWLPSRRTETGIRRTRKPEHALDLLLKLDKLTCGASFAAFGLYSALRLLL